MDSELSIGCAVFYRITPATATVAPEIGIGPSRRRGSPISTITIAVACLVAILAALTQTAQAQNRRGDPGSVPPPSIANPHYDHRYDALVVKSPQGFTHPGILHSRADLNRMRDMAQAGYQPWARGFATLRAVPYASKDYVILGPYRRVEHGIGQYEFRRDASAAYDLTLMWYITGNQAYAAKAIEILNRWSHGLDYFESDHITGGMALQKYCAAAEILRYTPSSGWKSEDIEQFKKFLVLVTPSVDKPNLFMNQGGYGLIGSVSIAVFLDDAALYRKQINRATVGDGADPLKDTAISKTIWPSGQVVEMGRDQGHPQGGLGTLACVAQTAYIQGVALSGVDLFTYLDDRLLKGYEYLAAHELGYDKVYEPLDRNGHKGYYAKFSPTNRGDLSPIYALAYNHYRYVLKVPEAQVRFTREALDYHAPEGSIEDFPGFGTLTDTELEGKESVPPIGPPREEPKPEDPAIKYGRIEGASFSGSKGVSREYYTDADGRSRLVASNIKADFSSWYEKIDFGPTPVDAFIVSAGSASPAGSKIDVMLDRPDAKPITTLQVGNTGWWSTFETFTSKLNEPVSGKHTVYLRFYGGNHVYGFQCNLDWFKFAHSSARTRNQVSLAFHLPQPHKDMPSHAATARDMDFDDGAAFLSVRVATTGRVALTLNKRVGNQMALVANFPLPDTHNEFQTVLLPMNPAAIYGRQDISLDAQGVGELKLDWFEFGPAAPRFPVIAATHYSAVATGSATKSERAVAVSGKGTTLAYPGIAFSNGAGTLSIKLAAAQAGTIEVRTMDRESPPFAVVQVPATGGIDSFRTIDTDIRAGAAKLKGVQMLFFTFPDAPMKIESFQLDPPAASPK